MLIGYARVSTPDQDLTMQIDALAGAGCAETFSDKASGAKVDRPGLAKALAQARAGDCLVVWKLDRLGRTMKGLVDLMGELSERKIDFRSLTDGIDTTTPVGRFAFHMLAAVAEMERELVMERTAAALAARRKVGGGGGRKPALTPKNLDTARKLLAAGDRPKDIAETLKVSVATFYRYFPASGREPADNS
jgi:DNA invertase Pin-like site-specific DNA recombinase